jgi:crotonobetainyl-CoA:carnitine CoA-transferase CaiB-like acyl-CoA transferase
MLGGIRVVDLSTGIAGAYATKLFADAGAEVIKVEAPGGDPLRSWTASGAAPGLLFEFLHQSKLSVIGEPSDAHVLALIAGADLVVESFEPGAIEALGLSQRLPGLVLLSISPYGRGGPWSSGHPSTDFTVQAESGSIAMRGFPGRPPVQMGGRLVEWTAGAFGGAAALAAVRRARRTGRGDHVDVSMLECSALITNLFMDVNHQLAGSPPVALPMRGPEMPSIEPTADGWVGFNTNAAQQFQDFLVLIERADLLEDKEFMSPGGRATRRGEIRDSMLAWTTRHTTDEIVERASLFRIPVAPVGNGRTLLEQEHLVARDVYVSDPSGRFKQPRPPYKIRGRRAEPPRPAPGLGDHTGRVAKRERPWPSGAPDPFTGLKVLDATCWWAGPACTQLFAYLGADVIHLESVQRPDAMRTTLGMLFFNKERWWEYSSFFLSFNQNKRDLTLNLADPRGRALAVRLIEQSDVLVENYSPRVFDQFGLDWDAVHGINPRIVMVRIPAFGLDGPWRERVGFAQTMEQFSGLAWVTGHPEDPPIIPRGPGDPLGGMHAAFALQCALEERERTGRGMLVEAPLVESALNVAAEQVIEFSGAGALLERRGNRSQAIAPQGLYQCLSNREGGETWLALSIATDEQWEALRDLLGRPDWSDNRDLATYEGRAAAHDAIDEGIGGWARTVELYDAVAKLLEAGVPAAAVRDGRLVHENPQIVARGFFERGDHSVVGPHAVPTFPFRFASVDRWTRTPAPTLGQHNAEILSKELGLDPSEIAQLEADGIIGEKI